MKKIFASIISIIVISISSMGVYWFGSSESIAPPEMTLSVGKQELKTTLGSYHIKSWFTEDDVSSPADSEVLKKIKPFAVSKNTKMTCNFSVNPKSVKFYLISENEPVNYELKDGNFISSKEPGIYAFKVETIRDQNQANFYFKIEVN